MIVRTLTRVKHDTAVVNAGTELYVRDQDAFQLIQSGAAEPATRGARKRFAEMLAIHQAERAAAEAEMAGRPKEMPWATVWTPGAEIIGGRRDINQHSLNGFTHV
jgi:hypothetical protein